MRHNIESGVLRAVAGNTLTAIPPPDAPGDYDDRYEMAQHLRDTPDRLAGPYDLSTG
jgi:hypothetical protein